MALAAAGAMSCLLLAGGCQRTRLQVADVPVSAVAGEGAELDFWHALPGRSAVSNSEGFHGVLLLADGTDPTTTWDERLAVLRQRGWVGDGFAEDGSLAMQRGALSKALAHALDIRGGVMMHVTGRSPRYAARELAYLNILQPSTENQVISGLDYIGIISRAQDYATMQQAKAATPGRGAAPSDAAPSTGEPGAVPAPDASQGTQSPSPALAPAPAPGA